MRNRTRRLRVFSFALMLCATVGGAAWADVVEVALPGELGDRAVEPDRLRAWFAWLSDQGFAVDRCGHNPATGTFVVDVTTEDEIDRLVAGGFTILRRDRGRPLAGDVRTQPQYFDPDEIATMLAQTAADHPDITHLFVIGTTFEGRDVWAIEISDNPGIAEDEPAFQLNAQHHSREVATSHIVMDAVDTLTDGYGVDPDVTQWVNNYKTVLVPMVNPDGVQYVFDVDSLWRKNRQSYPPSCIGVDLNRNYAYRWGPDRCGTSSTCSGTTYKGPSAASELETQTMVSLADDYHFVMATSYHSSGRFIDYPYACSNGSAGDIMPEHDIVDEMMNGVADAIDAVDSVPRYTVYSPASAGALSGDDTSWYYAHMGVYSFIIEVGTSFEPAFGDVAGIVNRNRAGWMYMYERLDQARIDVHVTDACTGAPLEAEVTLTDFVFDTGELPRTTFPPFGRWTFVVVADGSYTVRASRTGYVAQDVAVPVANEPVAVDIVLQPEEECQVNVIPAVTDWGLIVMLLLFSTVGTIALRRRSNQPGYARR